MAKINALCQAFLNVLLCIEMFSEVKKRKRRINWMSLQPHLFGKVFPVAVRIPLPRVGKRLQFILVEELIGDLQDGRMRPEEGKNTLLKTKKADELELKRFTSKVKPGRLTCSFSAVWWQSGCQSAQTLCFSGIKRCASSASQAEKALRNTIVTALQLHFWIINKTNAKATV